MVKIRLVVFPEDFEYDNMEVKREEIITEDLFNIVLVECIEIIDIKKSGAYYEIDTIPVEAMDCLILDMREEARHDAPPEYMNAMLYIADMFRYKFYDCREDEHIRVIVEHFDEEKKEEKTEEK